MHAQGDGERGSEIDERVRTGTAVECLSDNHHHHRGGGIMHATTVAAGVGGDDYGQITLVYM